ncbi:hypothetical protein LCGC14_2765600 [marine sediment metagenome]|uniref:Uncharacterized protein n=1 Tax=marine sediment metagenome TaxID=412755 RepID=A0A0F8YXR3_9ZZZZ
MSDLPTRESIELATGFEIRDWTALDTERVYAIVDAYLDATLKTEAEWTTYILGAALGELDEQEG